jgi:hypothetical protein
MGLQREKVSWGASEGDFAVKGSFRRSEKDESLSVCGSQRLLPAGSTHLFETVAELPGLSSPCTMQ